MMVNNSTNINKKKSNYLATRIIEHKNDHDIYADETLVPVLGQTHKWQGNTD